MKRAADLSICAAIVFLLFAFGAVSAFAQEKTRVNSDAAKRMLLGKHLLSLQWISWDHFGTANVSEKDGQLHLKGEQKSRENGDYLTIEGVVTELNRYDFTFRGRIVTQVSHINGGEPCIREGELTFRITGKRKYWRLQEMDSPCEEVVDYVDIFFRR